MRNLITNQITIKSFVINIGTMSITSITNMKDLELFEYYKIDALDEHGWPYTHTIYSSGLDGLIVEYLGQSNSTFNIFEFTIIMGEVTGKSAFLPKKSGDYIFLNGHEKLKFIKL